MLEILLTIIYGLCAGSFITMASYRFGVENEEIAKLIISRSFCPKCNKTLSIKNLIPLFSWIFQKGKCSFCKKAIPIKYPLIEAFTSLSFLICYIANHQNFDLNLLLLFLTVTLLILMIMTDLEYYFIPDITQTALFLIALIFHLISNTENSLIHYFFSGAIFLIFIILVHFLFLLLFKKNGIGIDDIKFFAIAGFFLGIEYLNLFTLLSGIIGVLFGVIWKKITKEDVFPFAPAICSSLMICIIAKSLS